MSIMLCSTTDLSLLRTADIDLSWKCYGLYKDITFTFISQQKTPLFLDSSPFVCLLP